MDIKNFKPDFITSKNKINPHPSKVGQAVYDILQKDQSSVEVQEIIDEYQQTYLKKMEEVLQNNINKYEPPFYVVVLTKKEPWAVNVMRNWFIARQTRPTTKYLRSEYPNYMNTVYSFDKRTSELKILWSLPTKQDAAVVLKNRHLYDPTLVKWIEDCRDGLLDRVA